MNDSRRKLYIFVCVINIIALWGLLWHQYSYDRRQAYSAAETSVSNLSKAFEENILGIVRHLDELLLDLRRDYPARQHHLAQHITSYNRHSEKDLIIQLSIMNDRGILIYNSLEMPVKPMDLSDREHFRVHRDSSEDLLFISKPVKGRVSNKWSIQFTRKLLDQNGNFSGVVVLSVDPEYFRNFYRTIDIGKQGVVTLLGSDGVIRARSTDSEQPKDAIGTTVPLTSTLIDPSKPPVGIYYAPSIIDGVSRIVSYRRLKNYPLVVRVALAENEVFALLNWHLTNIILQGVFASGALLLLLWLALRLNARQQMLNTELQNSRQQLSDIIDFLPDATFAIDNDMRVIIWNKAMEKMTGIGKAEILGQGDYAYTLPFYGDRRKQLLDLLNVDDSELAARYQNIQRQDNTLYAEIFAPALYGGIGAHLLVTGAPLYNSSGEQIGGIESIRDITAQKQNEQILLANKDELKSILDNIPVCISWSNTDGKVEYLNTSFIERFGYTIDDIPAFRDWFNKAYPEPEYQRKLRTLWNAKLQKVKEENSSVVTMTANVTCKSGEIRHVIINTLLSSDRILAIYTDISEQEKHHYDMLKTQKLESLGVLAGGIAHDFNNILTGILGNIYIAQRRVGDQHNAFSALMKAEKASQRAIELAYQLLTFSKGGTPIIKVVSARELLEESVSLVLRGANVKGEVNCSEDLHEILADPGQISQVFNNLIINALQAMPDGGMFSVTAGNMRLLEGNTFELSPGEYVNIIFSDQGCGISKENLHKIFDPYFTTKPTGTGLGLASAHSIITRHGGHISVQSTIGVGTSFNILLPASDAQDSEQDKNLTLPILPENMDKTILVMDDEEMIRSVAIEILGELGYAVSSCINGEEAIQMYRDTMQAGKPFAAVIMDLTIPGGMGGKEAAEQILVIDPQACLIVSSGYSDNAVMAECKEHGFAGVLPKPYKATELAQLLNSVIKIL